MNCPRCHAKGEEQRTGVLETTPESREQGSVRVRRRRKCLACGFRFTTFEQAQIGTVRQHSGRVEPFDEDRLRVSLEAAADGLDTGRVNLEGIVAGIGATIEAYSGTVDVRDVFRWTVARLRPYPDLGARYRERVGDFSGDENPTGWVEKRNRGGEPRTEPFDRQKLLAALGVVAHRRIDDADLQVLVDTIESRVAASDSNPVPTSKLREWIADELKELDPFAYLRVLSTAPNANLRSLREQLVAIEHGWVRSRHDRLEPFNHQQLKESIEKSAFKRTTISTEEITTFVDEVAERVRAAGDPVPSDKIVDWVLQWLKEHDGVVFMSYLLAFRPPDGPKSLERTLDEWRVGSR